MDVMAVKATLLLSMGTPRMKASTTARPTELVGAPQNTRRQNLLPGSAPSRLKLKSILAANEKQAGKQAIHYFAGCSFRQALTPLPDSAGGSRSLCARTHLELAVMQAVPHSIEHMSGMAISHMAPAADW